ncbi:uncharacterized protein TNCV_4876061 [Trichonephila clavipes]|uniref:Uncharacterized protein n=1 Tax=Trichonephila clavipes TaxID=2585209 RepID=A0A8X6RHQ0_TRICX|nr:uncharacterized protein TNCV_4876061 [Trichonephila clavipes]
MRLKRLQSCQSSFVFIHNRSLKELCNDYAIYEQQTLNGERGKTAQFYMIYIKLVYQLSTAKQEYSGSLDLTLEQTINADAARTLIGIAHLTNSRSRLATLGKKSRHTLYNNYPCVRRNWNQMKKQDISTELQPHNIKSCHQLEKFMNSFDQYVNPFSLDLSPDQLFNIASGKAASSEVEEFLFKCQEIGEN